MGYCQYYTNPNGNAVATWIGTSGEKVPKKQVIFLKGSAGAKSQTSACNEARKQFCALNNGCATPTTGKTPVICPGRCAPNQKLVKSTTSCKCVNNPITKPTTTYAPNSRSAYKPPTPAKNTSPSSSSSSSSGQDSYCKTNCDALPFFGNLSCRMTKWSRGCGGGLGGPPLEGNPFGQSGTALDPAQKNAVCAKNCETLDVFCKGAKIQAGCGGNDYTFWIIAGVAGLVGIVVLTRVLK